MDESGNLLQDLRHRLSASEFHTWAGMEVVEASAGEVTVAMDVLDRHVNLQGLVHGGMLAILADTACGLSIRSAMEAGRLHVTTDMDIHYLHPPNPAGSSAAGRRSRWAAPSPSPRYRSKTRRGDCSRERNHDSR